jgi:GR25 family glycosyltransferase involved in LPS biosynthesis
MNANVITITGNTVSEDAAQRLIASSEKVENDFAISTFEAIVPDTVDRTMRENMLIWNYPWSGEEYDMRSGLKKTAYKTADPKKRIACFLSHYSLWKQCAESAESAFIFEHDALFTSKVNLDILNKSKYTIIGLNNPMGATRRANLFHQAVQKSGDGVVGCPKVDLDHIPQGIAGNSAYYIKPEGAKKMLDLVKEYGAWPNDAIMCRQLLSGKLGVLNPYCTKIQGLSSTTTL